MTHTWLAWVAVTVGAIVGCVLVLEGLYRRRHPYVVGLRPFSVRRYARYAWGRVRRFPAEAARHMSPYWPWFPLLLRRPQLVRYFRRWDTLRRSEGTSIDAEVPWLALAAIEWLESHLDPTMRVFEWGSGGSTLFLARRVGSLVTVEHDSNWYGSVSERLKSAEIANCRYLLVEPVSGGDASHLGTVPGGYVSADKALAGLEFGDYCGAIDEYPDESFDLVVVDGRARASCIFHARTKVRPGGVMLVDNSERPDYVPGLRLLESWSRRDFIGPVAFNRNFSTTSIFLRPSA